MSSDIQKKVQSKETRLVASPITCAIQTQFKHSQRVRNMATRRSTRLRKAVLPTTTNNVVLYTGQGVEAENSGSVNRQTLRLNPIMDHNPESYEDLKSDYCPLIFSSLERHLPINMFNAPRDNKLKYIGEILNKYLSPQELFRNKKQREYRQHIISNYPPLHEELYTLNPTAFFAPSFLEAINANTEQSFRRIVSEPIPGIFVFEMLQPRFCELMVSEVENFEKWIHAVKLRVMRPNTMNKYGVLLDDFGFETMLEKLMVDFICPLSKVFFAQLGGSTLDSHHGFIVEYGKNRDIDLGLHVDDSEVSLNVCLGREFSGGDLFFRGMRCEKHVNTETRSEETFDYVHVPGQAVLHHGRHRHGARATISGHRCNLLLWCRSSVFREMKKYRTDFSRWCGECDREKKERQRLFTDNTKLNYN